MIFRKNIPRACQYCARATAMDEATMLCTRKGVVSSEGSCRKFRYDPFKRIPRKQKALDFSKFDDDDFSL